MIQAISDLSSDNDNSPRRSPRKARSRKRKKKKQQESAFVRDGAPHWMPRGIKFELLPQEVQADVITLVNPIYKELVLDAKSAVAKTTGLTIVHLMWLEIVDQIKLGGQIEVMVSDMDIMEPIQPASREQDIERHLRLVDSKFRASELLRRWDEFQLRSRTARAARQASKRKRATKPDRPRKPR